MNRRITSVLLTVLLCLSVSAAFADGIVVSAAASLTDVLNGLKPAAEKAVGCPISFNFGGSGALRKQIEQGAPADVFFSAAASDMQALVDKNLVTPSSKVDLLSNAIVLIASVKPGDRAPSVKSDAELKALLQKMQLLAIGNPDAVPAGRYAVQALKALDFYSIVEKKLVLGGNVREVLQYVQTASSPYGIVFLTDAMSVKPDSGVGIVYQFPARLTTPVIYPVGIVAASKNKIGRAHV